jgi:cell division septation protein DedD
MAKNETGEFELVLGNRQLLSGFAVVAILFGVFFAMGYIVGRNSTPSAHLQGSDTTVLPQQGSFDPGRVQPRAAAPTEAPPAPADTTTAANSPGGSDPAASASQASPAAPATPQPTTQAARSPEPAKPAEKPPEAAPKPQATDSPSAGAYLQVIATIQTDAEVISRSLQERHFPNIITPSSREGYVRVLVGPYKDSSGAGGAKTELEKLGFHPILVKIAEKN